MTPVRFRLIPFRSPLLRELLLLSFPRVTEMFQFTQFPLPALCVQAGVTPHYGCRVSPFGHPRVVARSAAHRGFSQPPTSFFGSSRQGIHRWLFVAWKLQIHRQLMKMLVFAVQFSRGIYRPQLPIAACLPPENWMATAAAACETVAPSTRTVLTVSRQ